MDAFILISFITGGIIIALVVNIITQHNKIKRFAERLRRNFGQIERKEYDPEKAASYRGYYLNHLDDDGFYIDDITWNDAEGETLYNSINKCYSSCGDEYLYYTLRCIYFSFIRCQKSSPYTFLYCLARLYSYNRLVFHQCHAWHMPSYCVDDSVCIYLYFPQQAGSKLYHIF